MKRFTKTAALIIAAVTLMVSLSSCSNRLKFKSGLDGFKDTKTGVTYHYVYDPLIPKSVSEEAYSVWKMTRGVKVDFFEIEGLEPTEWLYSSVGDLITSTETKEYTLSDFDPDRIYICYNADTAMSFAVIEDKAEVTEIVNRYTDGEAYTSGVYDHDMYVLLFESSKNPNFYYRLHLCVTEENIFIYYRYLGLYVEATEFFKDIVPAYGAEE